MIDKKYWIDQIVEFIWLKNRTDAARRGMGYALDLRVSKIHPSGKNSITAFVKGTHPSPYHTTLYLDSPRLSGHCSCPVARDCKHAHALALTLLFYAWTLHVKKAEECSGLLPARWLRGENAPSAYLFEEVAHLLAEESQISEKTEMPPAKPKQAWWREFIETEDMDARRAIFEKALMDCISKRSHSSYWQWNYELEKLFIESDPITILENFEPITQKLVYLHGSSGREADKQLAEFLRSEEARNIRHRYIENKSTATLLNWLNPALSEKTKIGIKKSQIEVIWFTHPEKTGVPFLCFQLLLSGPRLNRSPRNYGEIHNLFKSIEKGAADYLHDEKLLIQWLDKQDLVHHLHRFEPKAGIERDSTFPVFNVIEWLTLWCESSIVRWSDGAKIIYNFIPARLTVVRDGADAMVWMVELPAENGKSSRRIPIAEAGVMVEGSALEERDGAARIFMRDGNSLRRVETGGMPLAVFESIFRMPRHLIKPFMDSAILSELAERLHLGDASSNDAWISFVPVQPMIEIKFEESSSFAITISAKSEDGLAFTLDTKGRWIPCEPANADAVVHPEVDEMLPPQGEEVSGEAPPTQKNEGRASGDGVIILPRVQDVQPAQEWLEMVVSPNAEYNLGANGCYTAEWAETAQGLLQWPLHWQKRPPGVRYFGNARFRNLVTARPKPKLNLKIETSDIDWLKVSVQMEKELKELTLGDLNEILSKNKGSLVLLPGSNMYRRDDIIEYRNAMERLYEMGLDTDGSQQRLHVLQLTSPECSKFMENADGIEELRDLAEQARSLVESFKGLPSALISAPLEKDLRPYQRTGVDFLVWALRAFGGAILADDMGLGKTVQMLATLTSLRDKKENLLPSLVICPTSVVHNWQRESSRFTPELKTVVIGRGESRHKIYQRLQDFDLVIINYALARKDAEILAAHNWLLVCVDEAQMIKNPAADISKTVKELRCSHRAALTGTPIENRLLDLWSVVDFILPGYFPTMTRFQKRLKREDEALFFRILRSKLRPILLRRMKAEVAPELPPRIEEIIECEMTAQQKTVYLAEVKKARAILDGTKSPNLMGSERIQVLAALTRLRQICCDPSLVGYEAESGKTLAMMERVLSLIEAGHKVLVFSQFVQMLKRLEQALQKKNIPIYILTGQTQRRKELVEQFENDPMPSVFLISLRAGGLGLNLVSASHVILFDPWWNPAVEAQAIDRTHRIGQDKTVIAYRLITSGTLEEGIVTLQEKKRALVSNVLDEEAFNRALTRDDIAFILDPVKIQSAAEES